MPRSAPEKIGNYELGEVLGRGTVGTVYRAVDVTTGQAAALKILLPQVSADSEISARFEREIEILEKLSHPNVVGCYCSGKTPANDPGGSRWYYVMELVEGGTLAELLRAKRVLDWEDVVELGWQLCSALQHLHNNGVVHRDLKPSNVYFTKDGTVTLGDFGIALDTAGSALPEQGKTVGTWLYMSPEQIRGRSLDEKTDLYALGCLLYECLTGRPPFTGAGFADIFEQHLRRTPVPVKRVCGSVPTDLDAVVMELLAKEAK
ncbi:MAG: serine/threonine-protein kinase, partial [Planctomycetota bacterium]